MSKVRDCCDEYCPILISFCCDLPEAYDIRRLALERNIFWACHSNNKLPCVATRHNKFPEGAVIIIDENEFIRLTGYEC